MLTGCDVKYELYYKNADKVLENVEVSFVNSNALLYADSIEDYASDMFYGWKSSYNLKNYKYRLSLGKDISSINVSKTHNSLESVLQNNAFSSFFKNTNVYAQGDSTVLVFSEYVYAIKNDGEEIYLESDEESSNLYVTVKSNYKLESNADEKNEVTGIHKWVFTPEDIDKTLRISFSDDFNFTAYLYNLNSIVWVVLALVIAGVVILIVYMIIKKKSINVNKL